MKRSAKSACRAGCKWISGCSTIIHSIAASDRYNNRQNLRNTLTLCRYIKVALRTKFVAYQLAYYTLVIYISYLYTL